MRLLRAAVLAAAFFGSLVWVGRTPGALGSGRSPAFDFGKRTPAALIHIQYCGVMLGPSPEIAIHGDGRVHVDLDLGGGAPSSPGAGVGGAARAARPVEGGGHLLRSYDTRLEAAELEALLRDAAEGGLLRFDEAGLRARRASLGRAVPLVSDAPFIEIRLDFRPLLKGGWEPRGRALRRFVIRAPRQLATAFPEIQEYRAAWRLVQQVQEFSRRGRAEAAVAGAHADDGPAASSASSPPARAFDASSSSGDVVFRLTRKGGLAGRSIREELYGDGRLERVETNASGEARTRSRWALSLEESRTLLQIAVDHGLMDLDAEALHSHLTGIGPDGRAVAPGLMDAPIEVVEVFLTDYVGPGHDGGAASTRLSVQGSWFLARQFPESQELQGFLAILERIRAMERTLPRITP